MDEEIGWLQKDDTLSKIAKMFGTTVEALVEKNAIQNKDLIYYP